MPPALVVGMAPRRNGRQSGTGQAAGEIHWTKLFWLAPLTRKSPNLQTTRILPDSTASFISLNWATALLISLVAISPSFAGEPVTFTEGTLTRKGERIFLKAREYVAIQKEESDIYHANSQSYPLNKHNSISNNINMLNGFNCALNVSHVLNAVDDPDYDLRTWENSLQVNLKGLNTLYGYANEYIDPQRRSIVLGKNQTNYSGIKFVWFKNKPNNELSDSVDLHEFLNDSGLNKGIPVGSIVLTYLFYGGENGCNISYGASGHTGIVGNVGNKNMITTSRGKTYQANDLQDILLYHSNWGIDNVSHQNQWVPDPWITLMFDGNQSNRMIEDYQVNSKFPTIRPDNNCFDKIEIIVPRDIWDEYSRVSTGKLSTQPFSGGISPPTVISDPGGSSKGGS